MRLPIALFALAVASPASAHHEMIVATSMIPAAVWLVPIAVAALAAIRRWWK